MDNLALELPVRDAGQQTTGTQLRRGAAPCTTHIRRRHSGPRWQEPVRYSVCSLAAVAALQRVDPARNFLVLRSALYARMPRAVQFTVPMHNTGEHHVH